MMKKFSTMVIALLAAITMNAETVTVDTLTSAAFGFDKQSTGYKELSTTGAGSGVSYKAVANGAQKYIQIRTNDNTSGVVSTTSGGYIKSVQVVQNTEKGAKEVQIYGSNKALTGPADLYDDSKTTKLGALTSLDQTFTMTENYTYIGVRSASGARYLDKIIVTWTDTKPGKDPGVWTPDTISVSEALALIDKADIHTHYIKGVVASAPFILSSKNYTVWLTDIDNPSDSIQAFTLRKSKTATDVYTSVEEMAKDFGLKDTVLIFAEGISKYQSTYETTSGYYVETLGKSSAINANAIFKYGVGALQCGMAYDTIRYKYELVLSKTGTEDPENALHMVINSVNAKGIAGSYTIRNFMGDSSFVDGEGPVAGAIKITYVENKGVTNNYTVTGDFTIGETAYRLDTAYDLAGWTADYGEQFKLEDDIPFVPQEGDTITCAQALSYAKSLGTTTSGLTVYVKGYAVGFRSITGRTQQSIKMSDTKGGSNMFEAFTCYTQNLDSIVEDDLILVKGNILYYDPVGEIKKGNIYRIGGSSTQRAREISCVESPAGAITVAQALQIGSALQAAVGQTATTDEEYTVVGYIVDVNRQMSQDSATWYMHDEQGEYGDFKAYKCQIKNLIGENDYVYVKGKISKYQRTESDANIEITKGAADFVCAPTGIEEIVPAIKKDGTQKVILNGQLYILKDGVLYNALGTKVQ